MSKRINHLTVALSSIDLRIKEAREEKAIYRAHSRAIGAFWRKLNSCGLKPVLWLAQGKEAHPVIAGEYVPTITVNATLYDLDGLKNAGLMKMLGKLLDADYTTTKDYADYLNRDFHFWFRNDGFRWIRVRVCAYVKSDSPTCHKVLVGSEKRTVVEDRYEIVCN